MTTNETLERVSMNAENYWILKFVELKSFVFKHDNFLGSDCGSIGKVVASDSWGSWFEIYVQDRDF